MSANNQPPAEEQLFEVESLGAELFWAKHRGTILIGGAVAAAVVAAVVIWLVTAHQARLAAQALFADAANPDAWREVIARYPASPPAANAYFLLAESLREQGNLGESTALYQQFIAKFPKHSLVGGARLGLAENLALDGKTDEALAALRDVQLDANSYAAPFAALLEGRIMIRQGKLAEARRIFSTLISTHPFSPAAQVAGAQLEEILPLLPAGQ